MPRGTEEVGWTHLDLERACRSEVVEVGVLDREGDVVDVRAASLAGDDVDEEGRTDADRDERDLTATPFVEPLGPDTEMLLVPRDEPLRVSGDEHDVVHTGETHARNLRGAHPVTSTRMCFRVADVEDTSDLERRVAAIAALDQPLRRDLYRLLSQADGWTSRDEAATALGVGRPVAAFHLDKLVEAGVVEIRFERLTGRSGPGAGRPAKLYRPSQVDLAASVPERRYDLAGSLLAAAVADAADSGKPVVDCLAAVAHATGRQIGTEARAVRG